MSGGALSVFVVALPFAVPWAVLLGFVGVVWLRVMSRAVEHMRRCHTEYWVQIGRPWHSYLGPGSRRAGEPRAATRRTLAYPSFYWMWAFSLRSLRAKLAEDVELKRLHHRAQLIAWGVIVGAGPLVPFIALAVWVMFVRG